MQPLADENNPNALFVGFSPVIWFGLNGEPPMDCWCIDISDERFSAMPYAEPYNVERWKSFWFNHFWTFDWNVLFNHEGEGVITWMFAECGMEEPEEEFDAVKKCCPIKLCEDDSKAILSKKISDFFVRHARHNCAEVGR